jgi:N-acetylglucosaminyl-diphospho-decaprenol L-rhamnosyltransferase
MLNVGLLIVNYFTSDAVHSLCKSLIAARGKCELYVSIVDNSRSDQEFRRLQKLHAAYDAEAHVQFQVTNAGKNLGYAAGNNLAYRVLRESAAPIDVVIIANPDTTLISGSVRSIAEVAHRADALVVPVTISSGVRIAMSSMRRFTGRVDHIPEGTSVRAGSLLYPGGHFFAVSRSHWDLVNGFDEDFFLYSEELDLTLRLRSAVPGLRIQTVAEVLVGHTQGLSTKDDAQKSGLTYFHSARSRALLYRKHPPLRKWIAAFTFWRLLYAFQHLVGRSRSYARPILRGLLAGLTAPISSADSYNSGTHPH